MGRFGKIGEFIKETMVYGFANVFSKVFAMLLIPFYVKLGKEGYSNLVMLQSIFSVLTVALSLTSGVFFYYYTWEREKFRKSIFASWFFYQIIVAGFLLLGLFLFSEELSSLLILTPENSQELQWALILVGVQFFPYIINITNINVFRIQRNPRKVMYIVLLESVFTTALVAGGLEFFDFGIIEVVAAQVISRFLVNLFFLKTASWYMKWSAASFNVFKRLISFTWPFFAISGFQWIIISIDKFIGADILPNKDDVALLSLAMQLALPIVVLADMIRMAIGPFIMSIHKEKDADKTYQSVLDLSMYSSLLVLIGITVFSPWLTLFLANESYLAVLVVIPLIGFGNVISLLSTQLSISFSLEKKNAYLLISTTAAAITTFLINFLFMREYGFIVSGISQAASAIVMVIIVYFLAKRVTQTKLSIKNSLILFGITSIFLTFVYLNMDYFLAGHFWSLFLLGVAGVIALSAGYYLIYRRDLKRN